MRPGFIVAFFLAYSTPGFAQATDSGVTFEAASVKPAGALVAGETGGMRGGPGTDDPGRITIPRATLSDLLCRAYDVWPDQISGAAWLTHESKVRPGYELVVANGGTKLKEWTPPANALARAPSVDRNGFLRLPPGATTGFTMPKGGGAAPIRMSHRETMAMFCQELGVDINMSNGMPIGGKRARVIDKTGLIGTYEFTLEFARSMRSPGGDPGALFASDPGEGAPDIFAALEKQLGLKLVKVRDIPVDTLIVDSADKVPTEN